MNESTISSSGGVDAEVVLWSDPAWLAGLDRGSVLDLMGRAAGVRRRADAAVVACRAELARRAAADGESGCGRDAADAADAKAATGAGPGQARRDEQRARLVARLPAVAAALAAGRMSPDHVDALVTLVPDDLEASLIEQQALLAAAAAGSSVDGFRRDLRDWVRDEHRRLGVDRPARQRRERSGSVRVDRRSGMFELRAWLDPVVGAAVDAQVRVEYRRLLAADQEDGHPDRVEGRTSAQRMADAIANAVLDSSSDGSGRGPDPDRLPIVVIDRHILDNDVPVDGSARCEIPGVGDVSADTARRFACDARVDAVTHDHCGIPVAMHTESRVASAKQRRALNTIYNGCGHPDCQVRIGDCHVHHIVPKARGGPTALENLIPLCTRHHHLVHEGRWQLKRTPDWIDHWTSPDGRHLEHDPGGQTS